MVKTWHVFILLDTDGSPRYLGIGQKLRGVYPADALWNSRFKSDSSVAHWLRELQQPPKRGRVLGDSLNGLAEDAAREIFTLNRKALRQEGAKLLTNRDHATWKTGGGLRKPVVADGLFFPSVREASRFHGVDITVVIERLRSPKFADWYYQSK